MVSDPLAHYFALQHGVDVTVASETSKDGQRLASIGDNIDSVVVDVHKDYRLFSDSKPPKTSKKFFSEPAVIDKLIGQADLCVSLLPYPFHAAIAKMCIKHRTNMVIRSYITPELQALDDDAKVAGITIMNEAGLDPGIDQMLAMECIDRIHEYGGKVRSFVSFAGGLPAPEASDNALRYKFSSSPKAVLLALLNHAKYLQNGKLIELEGENAVIEDIHPIDLAST